ncbi:MAG: NAD-dependent epimerase/dehydratase family protein [Gammaproteobacteria bacterium]|nr:NAD-dependent epimerase/dehydratase family protein [Gammaproteobacteria bacterium]
MPNKTQEKSKRVFIAGHNGMVGSAVKRQLEIDGRHVVLTRSRAELDLTNQSEVAQFMGDEQIDHVYLCAAKVGGIHANNAFPADFIYQNLMIETNLIHQAYLQKVERMLFLGSSCIYPKLADQPLDESALLTGKLEPTNEPYAIAKIAGIKLCESYNRQYGTDFRSLMPTNLYGPYDNFHPENSHVIPALMGRFHEAKTKNLPFVTIWGTGAACREFLHVDDLARACLHVMEIERNELERNVDPSQSHLNVGVGEDVSIRELAQTLAKVTGYQGRIEFDTSRPDGTMRKYLNVSALHGLGWKHSIGLEEGLMATYEWYCDNKADVRLS